MIGACIAYASIEVTSLYSSDACGSTKNGLPRCFMIRFSPPHLARCP